MNAAQESGTMQTACAEDPAQHRPSEALGNDHHKDDDPTLFGDENAPERQFHPEQCLFCNHKNFDLEDNLAHMLKTHGLFIPSPEKLVVDVETLIAYFHLIVFGYFECLYCGSKRRSAEAVQQHMMGKGHCKFDLYNEKSEFRDFYNFSPVHIHGEESSGDSEDECADEDANAVSIGGSVTETRRISNLAQLDATTLRLASGKLLSHRSSGKLRAHRQRSTAKQDKNEPEIEPYNQQPMGDSAASDASEPNSAATALTRAEKRDSAFISTQLSRLRDNDRRSLMHLPTSQQRAILLTQAKQLDKARRAERAMQSGVESKGNKSLMKHFVNDVPGRANG